MKNEHKNVIYMENIIYELYEFFLKILNNFSI